MAMNEVTEGLRDIIRRLKNITEAYSQLDEGQQTAVRYALYQQEGSYAKAFKPILIQFEKLNKQFAARDEGSAS